MVAMTAMVVTRIVQQLGNIMAGFARATKEGSTISGNWGGGDAMQSNISQMGVDVKTAEMKQLINIALKVENEAKRRCPVATGYLRNSIAAGWDRKKSWVNVSANYGAYVEYGTYKMRAQPYLRPAIDKVKRELRR